MSAAGPGPEEPTGTLRPTQLSTLAGLAVVGLVGGWLLHRIGERFGPAPIVSITQPALLFLVAVMLGITAWATWRAVHVRHERLQPNQAVNRLVLARASALVGALSLGGYLGYALSWIGSPDQLADQRLYRSLAAALAGLLVTVAGLLLERACRVRKDEPEH